MFQGLLELIISLWTFIRPWEILQPDERGVRVRLGILKKEVGPGPHLKIWFIDEFHVSNVKLQPARWNEQSVMTKDRKTLAISGAIEYEIVDVVKYNLEVQDPDESLINRAMGTLARYVSNHKLSECTLENIKHSVTAALRRKNAASKWGIMVVNVHIIDHCEHKVYRVMGDGGTSTLVLGDD